jgi:hypothetical protein
MRKCFDKIIVKHIFICDQDDGYARENWKMYDVSLVTRFECLTKVFYFFYSD